MAQKIFTADDINAVIQMDKAITQVDGSNEELIKSIEKLRESFESTRKSQESAATKSGEYSKMLNTAATSSNKLVQNAKALEAQQKQLATTQAKVNVSRTEANKKLITQRTEIQKTNKEIKQQIAIQSAQKGSLKAIELTLAKNIEKYRNLTETERANKKIGGQLLTTIQKQDKSVKSLNEQLGRSQGSVGNYGKALQGVGKQLIGALGVTAGVTALVGVLKNAVKVVVDFEKAQSNLAALSGKTKEELKGLTDQALQLGGTTEFTATQVSMLQAELVKLGFSVNEINVSTGAILNFASATGAELPAAAKTAGVALRAFGLDASRMEEVTASLAVATTKSALSFEDYNTILATLGPVAKAYGFSLQDTIALTGRLKDAGFDASSAATATKSILLNLADSSGALAKELGRPVNTLDDLVLGLKDLDEKGVSVAKTLQLTDKRSVAAFNTFLAGGDSLIQLRDGITGVTEELQTMVDKKLDNLAGDVTKLGSAWQGLVLNARGGTNVFRVAVQFATDAVVKLSNLDLVFTRSSKMTAEQIARSYDVLLSLNDDIAVGFRKAINKLDSAISFKDLEKYKGQTLEYLKDQGFSAKEAEQVWGEYYKRRTEQNQLDIKAREDQEKQQAEFEKTQLIKKQEDEAKSLKKRAKEHEKVTKKIIEAQTKVKVIDPLTIEDLIDIDPEAPELDDVDEVANALFAAIEEEQSRSLERRRTLAIASGMSELDFEKTILSEKLNNINTLIDSETISETKRIELKAEAERIKQDIDNVSTEQEIENIDKVLAKREFLFQKGQEIAQLGFDFVAALNERKQADVDAQLEAGIISEEEAARKSAEIQRKQAVADKIAALFGIAVNTALAATKVTGQTGVGAALAVPLVIASGALQAATVLAQPLPTIPEFIEGTRGRFNTPSIFTTSEDGRTELMTLRTGEIIKTDKKTLFSGNKFKGARITSNPEYEYIKSQTSHTGFGGSSFTDAAIVGEIKGLRSDLKKQKTMLPDRSGWNRGNFTMKHLRKGANL